MGKYEFPYTKIPRIQIRIIRGKIWISVGPSPPPTSLQTINVKYLKCNYFNYYKLGIWNTRNGPENGDGGKWDMVFLNYISILIFFSELHLFSIYPNKCVFPKTRLLSSLISFLVVLVRNLLYIWKYIYWIISLWKLFFHIILWWTENKS